MLVVVVVLKYCTLHLFGVEVDRHEWQFVEGCHFRRAPYSVGLLDAPVAEGYYNVFKLQSLTLVYGYESDALCGVHLNGLRAYAVVPFLYKLVNVGGIVLKIVGQAVVECIYVCVFALYVLKAEYVVQLLCQFV